MYAKTLKTMFTEYFRTLYIYINRYLNYSVLHNQTHDHLTHFVFVFIIMHDQTHNQVHYQHKKGGVHNRSNRLEPRHYRISRLNTT